MLRLESATACGLKAGFGVPIIANVNPDQLTTKPNSCLLSSPSSVLAILNYQQMLKAVLSLDKPTALCTIYDQCPLLDPVMRLLAFTVLSMFNDCIIRQAVQAGLPLIDLRVICNEATDYSTISPVEPSMSGGKKIARAIATVMTEHNFSERRTVVY